jgi:hypothetical protein
LFVRTLSIPAWLGHHAWPLWLLLALIVACVALLRLSAWSRERRLRRKRAGVTQQTFTAQLEQYGFDPVITGSTFRYLREVQQVPFPVLPGDDLEEDLGLTPEEIDQSVRDLTLGLRRVYSPGLQSAPLVTVEDLIRLLQASPRITQTGVA